MKKKMVALILAAALLMTSFGDCAQALAATKLTEDNMTEVVLDMKGRFEIGKEYDPGFNHSFYESASGAQWTFYWNTADYSKSINLSCDGEGHVQSFYRYSNNNERSVPKYTTDELLDTVKASIAKIEPEIADRLKFTQVYCNSYNSSYTYSFVRIENGIEMPDNSVSISINYNTKEIMNYDESWLYEAEVPGADNLISEADAAAKIGKNVEMQLRYYITYDEDGKAKAFLAYTPDKSYVAVDAHSGKVYEERYYWGSRSATGAMDNGVKEAAEDEAFVPRLSEAEIAKIEELKDIISQEEAVSLIKNNKSLFIDKNLNTNSANLQNDGEGNYYWYVTMRDNRPVNWETNDNYRAYASARINAKTGELLSFSASLKSLYDFTDEEIQTVKANYTKTQCRKVAESFLKEYNGERFAKTVQGETGKYHEIVYNEKIGEYTYAGFTFGYDRVNENIPVNGNNIYIAVDAVSGKISNYNYSWNDEVELPSSKGIINADAAFENYIGYEGFDLVYEIETYYVSGQSYYGDDVDRYIRLVYRTAISPYFVDAFTGKQLGYDGTEYVKVSHDYNYIDIAGSKYERAIRILASMGVGFDGNEFKPEQVITRGEFQNLANALRGYIDGYSYSYKGISGDKALTRQMACKAVIGCLGLEKMAALDIYKTGYSDESKIAKGYVGPVALAKGLGIMKAASGKKFKPNAKVTRGEAAQILLNMTAVQ